MTENSDVVQKELACIIEKFPEYKLKILDLYALDEDFKSLCEDYAYCSQFLAQCALENKPANYLPAIEYKTICEALEQEAASYLQRSDRKSCREQRG